MFHSSAARVIISAKREKQWGHKFFYTNKSAQTPFCFLLSCSCDSVGFLWRLKTNERITSVSPVRRNMKLHRVFSVQTAILSPLLTSFSLTFCCFCWSEREKEMANKQLSGGVCDWKWHWDRQTSFYFSNSSLWLCFVKLLTPSVKVTSFLTKRCHCF